MMDFNLLCNCIYADNIADMNVTNYWELDNPNYYPIHLVSLNVQTYHDKLLTTDVNVTSESLQLPV